MSRCDARDVAIDDIQMHTIYNLKLEVYLPKT